MKRTSWRTTVATAALLATLLFAAIAAAKLNRTGDALTTFSVGTPVGLRVEGKTSEMNLTDDGAMITVAVPLGKLTTGVELQDRLIRAALEVDKYPSAELRILRPLLKLPTGASPSTAGDTKGALTLHGQTKDVNVHYTATLAAAVISIKGTTRIDLTDFGVKPPSVQGIPVNTNVDLTTSFSATDN